MFITLLPIMSLSIVHQAWFLFLLSLGIHMFTKILPYPSDSDFFLMKSF
jgi:hypothetical protein